jgi:polysaccharide deacetylase 2 family uncharacterized protein YibQ
MLLRGAERWVAPVPTPGPDWAADFPARIERITAALGRLPLPLPVPKEEPQGTGSLRWLRRHYELTVPEPEEADAIERALDPVRAAAAGVTLGVHQDAAGAQAKIAVDGLLTHTIALHWLGRRPRAAIIVDDLGNDLLTARALVNIDAPLTFAVMPSRPFSTEVAELAALFGREVLVHVPMEADSGEDFGARDVLPVTADRDDILRGLDRGIEAVPHAVGANNHMGSRFTRDRERMRWVLEHLKEKGLFFVDSATTAESVSCDVAATIALPCSARNLFLDDTDDDQAIRRQLDRLVQLAHSRGDVIAIGHPRPATLAALQAALPGFAAADVDLVPVSTIVADQSLSRR